MVLIALLFLSAGNGRTMPAGLSAAGGTMISVAMAADMTANLAEPSRDHSSHSAPSSDPCCHGDLAHAADPGACGFTWAPPPGEVALAQSGRVRAPSSFVDSDGDGRSSRSPFRPPIG